MAGKRVAIFEDYDGIVDILVRLLKLKGHEVVLVARTMDEARKALATKPDGSLASGREIDVAIVDGNLSPGISGQDGAKICELLAALSPRPKSIGYSGSRMAVAGADVQVPKGSSSSSLLEAIDLD